MTFLVFQNPTNVLSKLCFRWEMDFNLQLSALLCRWWIICSRMYFAWHMASLVNELIYKSYKYVDGAGGTVEGFVLCQSEGVLPLHQKFHNMDFKPLNLNVSPETLCNSQTHSAVIVTLWLCRSWHAMKPVSIFCTWSTAAIHASLTFLLSLICKHAQLMGTHCQYNLIRIANTILYSMHIRKDTRHPISKR